VKSTNALGLVMHATRVIRSVTVTTAALIFTVESAQVGREFAIFSGKLSRVYLGRYLWPLPALKGLIPGLSLSAT
jgi:hypothetical protein